MKKVFVCSWLGVVVCCVASITWPMNEPSQGESQERKCFVGQSQCTQERRNRRNHLRDRINFLSDHLALFQKRCDPLLLEYVESIKHVLNEMRNDFVGSEDQIGLERPIYNGGKHHDYGTFFYES